MTRCWLLLVVVVLVGCGDDGAGPRLPTSPTTVTPWPTAPVDPRFDDAFWAQLVYNAYDEPGDLTGRTSWVLDDPTRMNVYLRTTPWPAAVPRSWSTWIGDNIPRWVQELTGMTWYGQYEEGPERADRAGWITMRFIDPATEYEGYGARTSAAGSESDRTPARSGWIGPTGSVRIRC